MKMLKRLFSLGWFSPRAASRPPANVPELLLEPEEFARLIGSGRVEDLRILASKLSGQPKAHA